MALKDHSLQANVPRGTLVDLALLRGADVEHGPNGVWMKMLAGLPNLNDVALTFL